MADYNWVQRGLGYGLGIPLDPKWSWEDKAPPEGPVGELPNINPAPDRVINASGESMLSPLYVKWMEKYGYDYNPDGTPKYDIGYDPKERAKSIGQDKYQPNRMSIDEMERWKKGYDDEKKAKAELDKKIEDAKKAKEDKEAYDKTVKGRLNKFWEDGSARNAVLNSISETMLETRYGKDVYGSRLRDLPGNINDALQQAEATDMLKAQAALDMMKTEAETSKLNNPQQWLSDKQKQARDIASMSHVPGSPEWAAAYERELRQIAAPDLLSGSMEGITSINEFLFKYGSALDPATTEVMKSLVETLVNQVNASGGTGAPSQEASTIYVQE